MQAINMDFQTIIIILLLIVIVLIILYYECYSKNDVGDIELPFDLVGKNKTSIINVFQAITLKYPKLCALQTKGKYITYKEYYDTCAQIAEKILYHIGPHARVIIVSKTCPELFYMHIATMMAGGTPIILHTNWDTQTYQHILSETHADLVVVENQEIYDLLSNMNIVTIKMMVVIDTFSAHNSKVRTVSIEEFISMPLTSNTLSAAIDLVIPEQTDIATIVYDKLKHSVSFPKGIVQTHNSIMNSIWNCLYLIKSRSNINVNIKERYMSYQHMNTLASQLMDCYIPIASVGTVYFTDKKQLCDTIQEIKPTIVYGNTKMWERIMEMLSNKINANPLSIFNKLIGNKLLLEETGLDKLKYCINVDPIVQKDMSEFYQNLGIYICPIYGTNETGPIAMCVPGWIKGVGFPLMDIKFDTKTDEILVKGDNLFKAYHKNKKATHKAFTSSGWFKTKTTGYIDRDGSLYITSGKLVCN